jgi:hypothetical protein
MSLVVMDATLLVAATSFAGSSYRAWPDIPPVTSNAESDCLGIVANSQRHGHDFGLVVSPPLLTQVESTLRTSIGLRQRDIDAYLIALIEFARRSGGEIVDLEASKIFGAPHLNVPLSLASERRTIIVAGHRELLALGPQWGPRDIPIISPREFSVRVDASRRARQGGRQG